MRNFFLKCESVNVTIERVPMYHLRIEFKDIFLFKFNTFTVLISLHWRLKYPLKPDSLARIIHSITVQPKSMYPMYPKVHILSPSNISGPDSAFHLHLYGYSPYKSSDMKLKLNTVYDCIVHSDIGNVN